MDRRPPKTTSDEIDLYIRTYYSLLRTSGDVRVRSFEETHLYSNSSLHVDARSQKVDLGAFAYAAARLPACMISVTRVVLGQSTDQFERAGFPVTTYQRVRARGRRRLMKWDGGETLAVYITSASDIDDIIPILTAYQIEWNKMNLLLSHGSGGKTPGKALSIGDDGVEKLTRAFDGGIDAGLAAITERRSNRVVRLLDGSHREYRRTARHWWNAIEAELPDDAQVYFVSSNSHSLPNLLGGYVRENRKTLDDFVLEKDPEGLAEELKLAKSRGDQAMESSIYYYALRSFLAQSSELADQVKAHDKKVGIISVQSVGGVDVDAQVIALSSLDPDLFDPRLLGITKEELKNSKSVIVNIDYPLGMGAYHHLAEMSLGADLRGIYIMGKAATLNGRVGDVMVSEVVYDEHSKNTYVFENQFKAHDLSLILREGSVLDHQKAVTVRSAFLQNHEYMSVFYQEGYTVLEMEAGPYLSALYEMVSPKRHPTNEIVRLNSLLDLEVGVIHYASDTPYSRRQELLSKSMSFFGVDATYASAIAIINRIFEREKQG